MKIFYRFIGKLVRLLSKMAGKKGTDLPGKVLRKINKNILSELGKNFDEIVFITGTNGKTTTSNLIGYTLKKNKIRIAHNSEGANMLDGIISTLAIYSDKKTKVAIIEIDEGSIKKVMQYITPTKFVFNNFFRDQIDRFGEIDTLINTIGEQLKDKNIQLILNSDDPFVMRLGEYGKNNIYFGIDTNVYKFNNVGITESRFCPYCSTELSYDYIHYSQLGHYKCSCCNFRRKEVDYNVSYADVNPVITMSVNNKKKFITSQLGDFNIYNIISAYATLATLGISDEQINLGLENYHSKNGRMQLIEFEKKNKVILNLAKNPAGMNASLNIANKINKDFNYLFVLNDNGADGFDISWIWDSEFELIKNQNVKNVICSGKRANELALRLKYIDTKANIFIEYGIKEAVEKLKSFNEQYSVVIPNYTALVETQKELESK